MENVNFQIDTHVHILTDWRIQGLARWMKRAFPKHPVSVTATAGDLVNDLKLGGVTHFFNLVYPISAGETGELNDFNIEFCKNTPGAIPFAGMHQDTPNKAGLAEKLLVKGNVAGFKLHPFIQKCHILDSRFDRFYAFLQEAEKPLFFHTGFERFYNASLPVEDLHTFLKRYPTLPVVFVHMAYPELDRVFSLLDDYPNLYLDATGVFVFMRHSFVPFLPEKLAGGTFGHFLEAKLPLYKERIFFGSDHPVGWGDIQRVNKDLTFIPVSGETRDWLRYKAAKTFIDKYYPGFDWGQNLQKE